MPRGFTAVDTPNDHFVRKFRLEQSTKDANEELLDVRLPVSWHLHGARYTAHTAAGGTS